jgi:hypothetical protein
VTNYVLTQYNAQFLGPYIKTVFRDILVISASQFFDFFNCSIKRLHFGSRLISSHNRHFSIFTVVTENYEGGVGSRGTILLRL